MAEAKILTRLKSQLKAKGFDKGEAARIAISSLQKTGNLKKGSTAPTSQGVKRGEMGAEGRAKDRAAKYSGRKTGDFVYNKKTNRATLKGK